MLLDFLAVRNEPHCLQHSRGRKEREGEKEMIAWIFIPMSCQIRLSLAFVDCKVIYHHVLWLEFSELTLILANASCA